MESFIYSIENNKFVFTGENGETMFTTKQPSVLFDGEVMLKHGDIENIIPYYNSMKVAMSSVNIPCDLSIITFDTVSQESCDELNKLIHRCGYVKNFIEKTKKITY